MKKYRRKRILAILMCISMILSITSYAMPVNLASDSNSISPENSIELCTESEYGSEVYTEAESSIEESTESRNEESAEAATQESTEAVTQESTEAVTQESTEAATQESMEAITQESEESSTDVESKAETETSTEAETSTEIGESETTTENDESSSESSSEVMESESSGQTESSGTSSGGGSAGVESACEECGQSGSHAENCSQYSVVVEVKKCEECGAEAVDGAIEHTSDCSQYVKIILCEHCNATMKDGEVIHANNCVTMTECEICGVVGDHFTKDCTECPACLGIEGADHKAGCEYALAILSENIIGRTGKLHKGTLVYSEPDETSASYKILYTHEIIINDVLSIDEEEWYCYKVDTFIIGSVLGQFPYVKAADVELDEIILSPEKMTATEILSHWDSLKPSEKEEFLNYLKENDSEKYEEFNTLRFPNLDAKTRDVVVTFANLTETLPETEIVDYFDTKQELDWAWGPIPLDSEDTPEEEQASFDVAKTALENALDEEDTAYALMTLDEDTTEDDPLQARVNSALLEMVYAYYDAADAYGEDFNDYLEENSSNTLETYNVLVQYADFDMQTFAANDAYNIVGTQTDNIEVHLFNYGRNINNISSPVLKFTQKSYDVDGSMSGGQARMFPKLGPATMLDTVSDLLNYETNANGYPVITGWSGVEWGSETGGKTSNDGTGSLKYLFDKNSRFVVGTTATGNEAATAYAPKTNANYQSQHFAVENVQLFQKEGTKYVYNSAHNAAYYDQETSTLASYDYALRPYSVSTQCSAQGHFLPFNTIDWSNGSSQNAVKIISNGEKVTTTPESPGESNATYTPVYSDDDNAFLSLTPDGGGAVGCELSSVADNLYVLSGGKDNRADLAFGMTVEFSFLMPKDGKVGEDADDMIFDFMGDDDVLVYIDGKPVLNLGSGHGATRGTINFATGDVTVYKEEQDGEDSSVKNIWTDTDYANEKYQDVSGICTTLKEALGLSGTTFENYSTHHLKFYYLERFGTNANCWMEFNMEPLPKGALTVNKQETNLNDAYLGAETYTFQLLDKNGAGIPDAAFEVSDPENYGNPNSYTNGKNVTDESGCFKLKGSQTASFTGLNMGTEVYVKEIVDSAKYDTTCTVNGESQTNKFISDLLTIPSPDEVALTICFTNEWKTADLTVTKNTIGKTPLADKEYTFTLKVDEKIEKTFTLENGESEVIENLPLGVKYILTEMDPSCNHEKDSCPEGCLGDYKYQNPLYSLKEGTVNSISNLEVAFGTPFGGTTGYNLNADSIITVTNRCKTNLVITKTVIGEVKPDQSFKFLVIDSQDSTRKLEVILEPDKFIYDSEKGNSSATVTIKDMNLGTYTVKEDTGWSWRYEMYNGDSSEKTVTLGNINSVMFTNYRSNNKWFDGESWCKNIFNGMNTVLGYHIVNGVLVYKKPEELAD